MVCVYLAMSLVASCPLCEGEGGVNPVKTQVFGPDFVLNVLTMAVPFVLTISLLLLSQWESRR